MKKENIKKAIEENEIKIEYPLDNKENIEFAIYQIQEIIPFSFDVEMVGNNSLDWWLQCSYYSNKIKKTIIFYCDFTDSFENENEFIKTLVDTEKEIVDFENKIATRDEMFYFMGKLMDIAEECYPKYHSSDFIAECNDFLKRIDGEKFDCNNRDCKNKVDRPDTICDDCIF